MIIGFGIDITDIRRMEKALKRKGFAERIFTKAEQAKARSRSKAGAKMVAATYAKRFAAKEACIKALGINEANAFWQDIEVLILASGAPTLRLSGRAEKRLQSLAKGKATVHVALSDEYPYAMAQVIISAHE